MTLKLLIFLQVGVRNDALLIKTESGEFYYSDQSQASSPNSVSRRPYLAGPPRGWAVYGYIQSLNPNVAPQSEADHKRLCTPTKIDFRALE